jgi:hypothetical protein
MRPCITLIVLIFSLILINANATESNDNNTTKVEDFPAFKDIEVKDVTDEELREISKDMNSTLRENGPLPQFITPNPLHELQHLRHP